MVEQTSRVDSRARVGMTEGEGEVAMGTKTGAGKKSTNVFFVFVEVCRKLC